MGQVFSIIWSFLRCSNGGLKGKDQTPTDDDHHDQQQKPESHNVTIYDPLLSNDTEIGVYNNTPTIPCTVLDLSRLDRDENENENDVEGEAKDEPPAGVIGNEEKVVEVVVVVEEKPSKGKKKRKKRKEVSESTASTSNIIAKGGVSVKTSVGEKVRRIGPYTSTQRILLVGEGDFSFSACLAVAFGTASNMIATSFNTREFLVKNYGKFLDNNNELLTRGCIVLHSVDATKMKDLPQLCTKKFDRIIFNFPHAGKFGRTESEIKEHKKLIRGFLRNAKKMIDEEDGEIHVTHKSNGFFFQWDVPKIGSDQGLYLLQEVKFERSKYPGYHTKYGFGGDRDFECSPSKTYKFGLATNTD